MQQSIRKNALGKNGMGKNWMANFLHDLAVNNILSPVSIAALLPGAESFLSKQNKTVSRKCDCKTHSSRKRGKFRIFSFFLALFSARE